MRNKLYKILAAGFGLALAFTFSCSSDGIGGAAGAAVAKEEFINTI